MIQLNTMDNMHLLLNDMALTSSHTMAGSSLSTAIFMDPATIGRSSHIKTQTQTGRKSRPIAVKKSANSKHRLVKKASNRRMTYPSIAADKQEADLGFWDSMFMEALAPLKQASMAKDGAQAA